jgi:hypothetical protein
MSGYRNLRQTGETVTLIAVPNGRVKYGVFAYRPSDAQTPIFTTDANLNDEKERARIVGELPADAQAEAEPMLKRLAAGVAEARLTAKGSAKKDDTPFREDEPWPDDVDGAALASALETLIARFMMLPPFAETVIALWLIHTYLLPVADYSPYILVTSPVRECGKTTLLELLLHLAYRAQFTGGITAAALYRRIARHSPTMLLDELDTRLRGDSGELLRGVLNTGFHRSGKVTICVGEDQEDRDFSTFCPKVLAGIGRVWDTVTSRSIPIRLQRAPKARLATLDRIRGDRIDDLCQPYRRQLLKLADLIRYKTSVADPVVPNELGARQADVWRPLLAIADAIGGEWPARSRAAACALHGVAEDEGDYGLLMLEDVRALFIKHGADGKLASSTIVEELVSRDDRPWPEYGKTQKPISARGVAQLLARFGAKSHNIRLGGENGPVVKGYELGDLKAAFDTYLPPLLQSATSATGREKTLDQPFVAGVADRNEGRGVADRGEAWEPDESQLDALEVPR